MARWRCVPEGEPRYDEQDEGEEDHSGTGVQLLLGSEGVQQFDDGSLQIASETAVAFHLVACTRDLKTCRGWKNTDQVQRQSLRRVAAQGQVQHLLGEGSQHQQRHQGQGDAEAQQGHEAALAARPPVTGAGQPANVDTRAWMRQTLLPAAAWQQAK